MIFTRTAPFVPQQPQAGLAASGASPAVFAALVVARRADLGTLRALRSRRAPLG